MLTGDPTDLTRQQGDGVAMSGDGATIAVASAAAVEGAVHGMVYVYLHGPDGWHIQAALHPRDADLDQGEFGGWGYYPTSTALSADGNLLAVGYTDIAGDGSVASFSRTGATWTELPTLFSPRPRIGAQFGAAVSMSGAGDTLLVGEPGPVTWNASQRGAVWVFARTTTGWGGPHELSAPNPDMAANYGGSLALSRDGRTAVVQSNYTYFADPPRGAFNYSPGHVYIYTVRDAGGWRLAQTLPPEAYHYSFGNGLALSGDGATIVVGDSENPASAFVYDRTSIGWTRSASFHAQNLIKGGEFGQDVAISDDGNHLIITAPYRTARGGSVPSSGSAFRFNRNSTGWHWGGPLWSATPRTGELLGYSVSMSADGSAAVLGAPSWYDWAGPQPGRAYVFTA